MSAVLDQAPPPRIAGSRPTRASDVEITQAVADPLFAPAGKAWWIALLASLPFVAVVHRIDRLAVLPGHRHLGHQLHRRVGRCDRELRLVDRHRQCRHADFGDAAVDAAAMAQLDQPLRRGDDAVRRRDRRHHADHPSRTADLCLLACALSEHDGALAAMAQRAGVGFLGDHQLSAVLDPVLVRQPDPRPRHHARPHHGRGGQLLYGALALGWRGSAQHWRRLRRCTPRWRRSAFRWCARCIRSSASISPRA